jgi:hypothetical protein
MQPEDCRFRPTFEAGFRAWKLARSEPMNARIMPTHRIIQFTLTEWIIERRAAGEPLA